MTIHNGKRFRVLSLLVLVGLTAGIVLIHGCGRHDLWGRIQKANVTVLRRIDAWERQLEATSRLAKLASPPLQACALRLGCGNEKVYLGSDGWLFLRHDIDYLTGPGFLSSRWFARRSRYWGVQRVQGRIDPYD